MAKSLEEAQAKYRAADKELLAARNAFDEAPWRVKTWKRLQAAEAAYRAAMNEYSPWITGNHQPDIKIVE
jgi:hypothetical protein